MGIYVFKRDVLVRSCVNVAAKGEAGPWRGARGLSGIGPHKQALVTILHSARDRSYTPACRRALIHYLVNDSTLLRLTSVCCNT